jgi:RNA polymerase sigma-70 factor (ECF subfamily)
MTRRAHSGSDQPCYITGPSGVFNLRCEGEDRPAVTNRDNALGDEQAAVIADLYRPLRRFAGIVGPIELDPDDLVQEAWVRTLRVTSLSELDDPGAYLRRVIVNLASSHRRRFARRRSALSRWWASESHSVQPIYPSDVAELLRLRPKERAVLYLHDVEGYSFQEVAEMLDMSETALRMMASRARRRLHDQLREEEKQ